MVFVIKHMKNWIFNSELCYAQKKKTWLTHTVITTGNLRTTSGVFLAFLVYPNINIILYFPKNVSIMNVFLFFKFYDFYFFH